MQPWKCRSSWSGPFESGIQASDLDPEDPSMKALRNLGAHGPFICIVSSISRSPIRAVGPYWVRQRAFSGETSQRGPAKHRDRDLVPPRQGHIPWFRVLGHAGWGPLVALVYLSTPKLQLNHRIYPTSLGDPSCLI